MARKIRKSGPGSASGEMSGRARTVSRPEEPPDSSVPDRLSRAEEIRSEIKERVVRQGPADDTPEAPRGGQPALTAGERRRQLQFIQEFFRKSGGAGSQERSDREVGQRGISRGAQVGSSLSDQHPRGVSDRVAGRVRPPFQDRRRGGRGRRGKSTVSHTLRVGPGHRLISVGVA